MTLLLADSTPAGIITAVASLVTAFGLLLTSVGVFIPMFKSVKRTEHSVNSAATASRNYQRALIRQLTDAGILPVLDQSLDEPAAAEAEPPTVRIDPTSLPLEVVTREGDDDDTA